jgi:Fe-S-cluster formation regulator IscX/YfhJ
MFTRHFYDEKKIAMKAAKAFRKEGATTVKFTDLKDGVFMLEVTGIDFKKAIEIADSFKNDQ